MILKERQEGKKKTKSVRLYCETVEFREYSRLFFVTIRRLKSFGAAIFMECCRDRFTVVVIVHVKLDQNW